MGEWVHAEERQHLTQRTIEWDGRYSTGAVSIQRLCRRLSCSSFVFRAVGQHVIPNRPAFHHSNITNASHFFPMFYAVSGAASFISIFCVAQASFIHSVIYAFVAVSYKHLPEGLPGHLFLHVKRFEVNEHSELAECRTSVCLYYFRIVYYLYKLGELKCSIFCCVIKRKKKEK